MIVVIKECVLVNHMNKKITFQTNYNIVKVHRGELKVETLSADLSAGKAMKAEAAAQAGKKRRAVSLLFNC